MGNKFDIETANDLCELLKTAAETMESENQKIQNNFIALHETFKDKAYDEFQSDFNAADRTMSKIIADLREIHKALSDYKTRLMDAI